ncbi:MAG: type 4a pilus biogenesis protein PilO [Geobacter sp.]|nr:type 4a pilus biogenesis protein PilO [Geobacter sp.]
MDPRIEKTLKLPTKQKIALLILIILGIGAALYFSLYMPKLNEYKELQASLEKKQKEVDENRKIADNLPKFKQEFENLNLELQKALTELPNQKEIPSLLTSITGAGKSAGLDFLIFRPKPEEPKDFYAAVPVDITVAGSFHNTAAFFKAVAELPRIVNINNVVFSDPKNVGGRMMLKVTCLSTTFRFVEKKETKDEKKGK